MQLITVTLIADVNVWNEAVITSVHLGVCDRCGGKGPCAHFIRNKRKERKWVSVCAHARVCVKETDRKTDRQDLKLGSKCLILNYFDFVFEFFTL